MIKGIGTDILEINKLYPIIQQEDYINDSFIRKVFTDKEIELAESRPIPVNCYATRFSGKEAVFKALGVSSDSLRLNEIEILSDKNGKPYVNLLGKAARIAKEKEITQILISLSYDNKYSMAFCIAQ
ncbi:holo-ACP synthase [Herbinix luporum]|jgi:phosphopantetheine--protein transferase-like protein|uniref:holo-ACP synthase n=1 Tax=Herbinix luporum TaxID=1679721 RepID=UPI0023F2DDFC|nr:holo-ACP synthase [Herbinix luporum]